jgi:hypothetical protein
MGEGEPDEDLSTRRDNSMTQWVWYKKGGHGTSLFYYVVGNKYLRYIIHAGICSVSIYWGRSRKDDL